MKLLCEISSLIVNFRFRWKIRSSQTFGKTSEDFPTIRINQSKDHVNTRKLSTHCHLHERVVKRSEKRPLCLVLKQYMVVYQAQLQKEHLFNANEANYIIINSTFLQVIFSFLRKLSFAKSKLCYHSV